MIGAKSLRQASRVFFIMLQHKEISILKRVSFNRNVVQFYGFCLDKSAPMLVRASCRAGAPGLQCCMPAC